MVEIIIPFKIEDLKLKPEITGRIKLSDDMQQTLASLVGYDGTARRLLRCSSRGILSVKTPRIAGIINTEAQVANYDMQLSSKPASEVMIMGHPDNAGLIWVKNDDTADEDVGWPVAKSGVVSFSIDNLNNINLNIPTAGDRAIIAYSR